jgi:hypothetical protein
MTLLPIVERELRIASRRWLTFWGRVGAAGFVLAVFIGIEVIAEMAHAGFRAGRVEFGILKWMCFGFACAAGLFLTADCISEEKREGTLGLLFLTDLRGYDVVLGKLLSRSLQAVYGLVAAIPILGLTLLVGGVAGYEFGHSLLVIGDTLFFSLCAGLFISSVSRDVMKAMNGTLFLLLFILVGLLLADLCIAGWDARKFRPILSMASPAYLFTQVGPYPFRDFWFCLGIQHGLAWLLLALSCICTPRAWQEKATQNDSMQGSLLRRWRFGGKRFRLRFRRKWLDRDPILWLAVRDRWLPRFVWGVIIIGLLILAFAVAYNWSLEPLQVAAYVQAVFGFGLILWLTSQACRFFVDAIRTGALELILVTPIVPAQVVRSQRRGLVRIFLIPALVLVAINVSPEVAGIWVGRSTSAGIKYSTNFSQVTAEMIALAASTIKFIGNLVAVAWFGMWMGMTTRKTAFAIFKTICFVIILPAIALWFAWGMTSFMFAMAKIPFWMSPAVIGGLSLAKNIFFIVWARQRLSGSFREAMLRESRIAPYIPAQVPPRMPPPPPPPLMPPQISPPPVLPSGVT